jgi:hypothetical protein
MQRNKSFLVVCLSILIGGGALAQDGLTARFSPAGEKTPITEKIPAIGRTLTSGKTSANGKPYAGLLISEPIQWSCNMGSSWKAPFTSATGAMSHLSTTRIFQYGFAGAYTSPPPAGWNALASAASPRSGLAPLEEDYYSRHFGFFCKRELELEKSIHVPLRFRLGSLESCNRLEGK